MGHVMLYAIVPVMVVMLAGYVGGRRGVFGPAAADVLNRVVLDFALPAALFVSIAHADRDLLVQNIRPALAAFVAVMLCFVLVYLVYKYCFRGNGSAEGAVMALLCGSPAIGFMGFAVLQPIFGVTPQVGLVVAVVGIVVNAVGIPLGLFLLNRAVGLSGGVWRPVGRALAQPVVWAPALAVVLVACGVRLPDGIFPSLELLAGANASVAVFAVGVTLSATRLRINRETVLGALLKTVAMPTVALAVGVLLDVDVQTVKMLVVAGSLPPAFTGTMIAGKYGVYVANGASSLALGVLSFVAACPLWLIAADALLG